MLKLLTPVTLTVLLALSGCSGLKPLYGTNADGSSVVANLSALNVEEQRSRAGQIIRNELLDGVTSGQARFVLKLQVTERVIDVANLSSTLSARKRYVLSAHYELAASAGGKSLSTGDSFSNVEFDTINIPVSDLQAADDARTRAGKEVGQDLKLRVATYLSGTKS